MKTLTFVWCMPPKVKWLLMSNNLVNDCSQYNRLLGYLKLNSKYSVSKCSGSTCTCTHLQHQHFVDSEFKARIHTCIAFKSFGLYQLVVFWVIIILVPVWNEFETWHHWLFNVIANLKKSHRKLHRMVP